MYINDVSILYYVLVGFAGAVVGWFVDYCNKMFIKEEKILSNIDKVQKLINPNSKKQIVQLEDDAYFKDLIDSIKVYLVEYPNKKNFPASVYNAAHELYRRVTGNLQGKQDEK